MPQDENYQEQYVCFTLMDIEACLEADEELFFSMLERNYPQIYDKLEAYLANKQVQEFLTHQEEVL